MIVYFVLFVCLFKMLPPLFLYYNFIYFYYFYFNFIILLLLLMLLLLLLLLLLLIIIIIIIIITIISCNSPANKTHVHKKGFAPNLALKVRVL